MKNKSRSVGSLNHGSFHGMSGMVAMSCCAEHANSKAHFETKKQLLEDKLHWIEKELAKKE